MVQVRKATQNDIPTLIHFQQQMAMETEGVTLFEDTVRLGMRELFSDPLKGQYYVAEINGDIAGCLMTTFEWSEWRNGNVLWIQSVYIAKAFRNRSIYKTLYEHLKNEVSQRDDLRGIRLYVDRNNTRAQQVYQKLGMNGDHYQVFEWMKS